MLVRYLPRAADEDKHLARSQSASGLLAWLPPRTDSSECGWGFHSWDLKRMLSWLSYQASPLTLAALVVPHTVPVTVGPGPRAQEAEEKQNSHTSL